MYTLNIRIGSDTATRKIHTLLLNERFHTNAEAKERFKQLDDEMNEHDCIREVIMINPNGKMLYRATKLEDSHVDF